MDSRKYAILISGFLLITSCQRAQHPAARGPEAKQDARLDSTVLKVGDRPVYPYSVIPGGVASPEDIKLAIQRDPVVADHYDGLDPSRLQKVTLERDTLAYVSFRKDGKIYWTSRKIKLAAGETVFLGAGKGVRGRCGNQVSNTPQTPVIENAKREEPTPATFDTPVTVPAASQATAGQASATAPSSLVEAQEAGPASTPISGGAFLSPLGGVLAGGGYGVVAVGGGGGGGGGGVGGGQSAATPPATPAQPSTGSPSTSDGSVVIVATATPVAPVPVQVVEAGASSVFVAPSTTSVAVAASSLSYGPVEIYQIGGNSNSQASSSAASSSTATTSTVIDNNSTSTSIVTNNIVINNLKDCGPKNPLPPTPVATPEPATWMMCLAGVGLIGMGSWRRGQR